MGVEEHPAYKGEGPVMNIVSVGPCEKPKDEVVPGF
jgi:putative membrane protein